MTLAPGIHALGERDYHADSVSDVPSLSASIAHILVTQSPRHAWTAHPRLNPDRQPREDEKFDVGKVAHRILLEGSEAGVTVIDASDWRTKAAQEARDDARLHGRIPLLAHQLDAVRAMVGAARAQLVIHKARPPLFTDGQPETCIVWDDGDGVMCRARLDWLRDDFAAIDDLKTTSRSARPEAYSRALFGVGGDVQAAMYVRGVHRLTGVVPEFRWVVVETSPPFALSVISPTPAILELGRSKVERALRVWRECLQTGEWPAYTRRVAFAELPAYEEARWLEREFEEVEAA